jgi:hypothetical protein
MYGTTDFYHGTPVVESAKYGSLRYPRYIKGEA